MKRRVLGSAVLIAGVLLAGCGSAGSGRPSGGTDGTLVVWDWKSGDKTAAAYIERAKARFAEDHPGVTVKFVAQPFEQYYTLLGAALRSGAGPDVMLFNGGGRLRDRAASLLPLGGMPAGDRERLAGWEAFTADGTVYAAPVTLQGHPIYYNKALYAKAGLDPGRPATTWSGLVEDCAAITEATGARCFSLGNKEGFGIQFFLSGLGPGVLTPREYDDWIAGKRDWTSPGVRRIFELWKEAGDRGLNTAGANSTALFNDAFARFESGKAAHVVGLMSDVGHWKEFGEFLDPGDIGVMPAPRAAEGAEPALPYDGGIGYAVAKGTAEPELATDLVRALTSTEALRAFHADAGAVVSDTEVEMSGGGPALDTIVAGIGTGRPALHVALSSRTLDLMGRLSQQILSGSAGIDEALRRLAASERED
ncbi:ABC transporter substrate-binding protein [Streptomyces zingiberis]|uniref:Carbohydrate ABC transporter substrate-binding protein n=1 Tax=Streptomyces zingiberis TaxID=2053010 RepID=A0ABX1BXQ1_9ACTN|nr:ABC transporter substrate-binding protein [Streptomyces zingiberis]NJQ02474.1 carbohydrate ABC transporter substrate-binding protein [Streptomyces zingiberis]